MPYWMKMNEIDALLLRVAELADSGLAAESSDSDDVDKILP